MLATVLRSTDSTLRRRMVWSRSSWLTPSSSVLSVCSKYWIKNLHAFTHMFKGARVSSGNRPNSPRNGPANAAQSRNNTARSSNVRLANLERQYANLARSYSMLYKQFQDQQDQIGVLTLQLQAGNKKYSFGNIFGNPFGPPVFGKGLPPAKRTKVVNNQNKNRLRV